MWMPNMMSRADQLKEGEEAEAGAGKRKNEKSIAGAIVVMGGMLQHSD